MSIILTSLPKVQAIKLSRLGLYSNYVIGFPSSSYIKYLNKLKLPANHLHHQLHQSTNLQIVVLHFN